MEKHIIAWINNETVLSWPIVATEDGSLYYEGKLVGVTFEGKKALRKKFAKENGIELENYNEEWGIIEISQVTIKDADKKVIASDCINMDWLQIRETEGLTIASVVFGSRTTQVFAKRFLRMKYNF